MPVLKTWIQKSVSNCITGGIGFDWGGCAVFMKILKIFRRSKEGNQGNEWWNSYHSSGKRVPASLFTKVYNRKVPILKRRINLQMVWSTIRKAMDGGLNPGLLVSILPRTVIWPSYIFNGLNGFSIWRELVMLSIFSTQDFLLSNWNEELDREWWLYR